MTYGSHPRPTADQHPSADLGPAAIEVVPTVTDRLRLIQLLLGLLWITDGILQLQPFMFGHSFVPAILLPAAQGNPRLLANSITTMAHFIEPRVAVWNAFFAIVQLAIGVGLLTRRAVRPALAVSLAWSVLVWWFGEGFGLLLTGQASPLNGAPGAVLLYGLIGLLVWPRQSNDRDRRVTSHGDLVSETGGRTIWTVLWVGYALLLIQPANLARGTLANTLLGAAAGEPRWLADPLKDVAFAIGSYGPTITIMLAAVMAAVGLGVMLRRHERAWLGVGAFVALVIWFFGQALGGVFTGQGTDPNTGPLLVLLAFSLYRLAQGSRIAATPARLVFNERVTRAHGIGRNGKR